MRSLALLFVLLCSCSDAPKSTKALTPPTAQSIGSDGSPVQNAPQPEVVQLIKVETVDGITHSTVGNVAGEYVLVCNPDANKDSGVHSCLAPRAQRDYLLFRKDTKWLMKEAKQPLSLSFMQDFSVTYNKGENIGLLPARNTDGESFRVYWLLSWTAK
jgi:hypothetical protein